MIEFDDDLLGDELYEAEQEFFASLDDLRFAVSAALTDASLPQDVAESLASALEATKIAEKNIKTIKKSWTFYR